MASIALLMPDTMPSHIPRMVPLTLRKVPIEVRFLPPIDTSAWTRETLDAHLEEVYQAFVDALPKDQRPLVAEARAAA